MTGLKAFTLSAKEFASCLFCDLIDVIKDFGHLKTNDNVSLRLVVLEYDGLMFANI